MYSGNKDATREEIEEAAREANCEFVWGMPKGFDTESEHCKGTFNYCIVDKLSPSRSIELERWTASATGYSPSAIEEPGDSCA